MPSGTQVSLGAKEPKKAAVNLLPRSKLGAAGSKPASSGGILGGDFLTKVRRPLVPTPPDAVPVSFCHPGVGRSRENTDSRELCRGCVR